jgi:leader peptidase (prepilin peptidase)/N-methyltransferase
MNWLKIILIFFIIFASPVIGSYLATQAIRAAATRHVIPSKRSQCPTCHHLLNWLDLLPIFSYLLLKGRCRYCDKPISTIYFFSELTSLITAIISIFLFHDHLAIEMLSTALMAWFLIGLSIFDIKTQRLPDIYTIPFLIIGLLQSYYFNFLEFPDSFIGMLTGGVIASTVAIFYKHVRGRIGLGWGDVKLIAAFGSWLGWQILPFFILGSSVLGILFLLIKNNKNRVISRQDKIPFGPFLCGVGWLLWLLKMRSYI